METPAGYRTKAVLEDTWLNTTTPLSASEEVTYDFAVSSDPLSNGTRFRIVVEQVKVAVVTPEFSFTSVNASPAPRKTAQVEWSVANQQDVANYVVESSANGSYFTPKATLAVQPPAEAGSYSFADMNPFDGTNHYRIKATLKNGEVKLSDVVTIEVGKATGSNYITVNPNPVVGRSFMLNLRNLEAGNYTVAITNLSGNVLLQQNIAHSGNRQSYRINLPADARTGTFKVVLYDGMQLVESVNFLVR
jgi:hypothetical protein